MKHFFPFFFLFIMTLNVAIPLLEQLKGGDLYELVELGTDDADEEGKAGKETEKDKEKEKEPISFTYHKFVKKDVFKLGKFKKSLFSFNVLPLSELYTSSPELPPEV